MVGDCGETAGSCVNGFQYQYWLPVPGQVKTNYNNGSIIIHITLYTLWGWAKKNFAIHNYI